MDVTDLRVSVPCFSQSLLYSETRCDKQLGMGPAMRKIAVRSVERQEERGRKPRQQRRRVWMGRRRLY